MGNNNFRHFVFLLVFVISSIRLSAQVTAGFTIAAPVPNCNPAIYSFINSSTGTAPLKYEWNFGVYPGINSVFQNPSTSYLGCGTFTVKLVVTDGTGKKDSSIQQVNIKCSPLANFTASGISGCVPNVTTFTNASLPGSGSITRYLWDFGDGYADVTANPKHTYNLSGCKNVTLIVTNTDNCTHDTTINNVVCTFPQPVSDFTSSTVTACAAPFDVTYQPSASGAEPPYTYKWVLPGGTPPTSTDANPVVRYNTTGSYSATLITTDAKGCSDTITKANYVSIGNNTVDFTMSSVIGCINTAITTSGASPNLPLTWQWTSTAGTITNGNTQNASVVFTNTGTYDICLQTTYAGGCTAQKCTTITVQPAPVANYTVAGNLNTCIKPNPITFTNNSTGTGLTYLWSFPGGSPASSTDAVPPVITYANCGSFSANLTIKDDAGCTATFATPNYLNVTCPVASFAITPFSGCTPLTSNFNSSTSTGNPILYEWSFGDSISGTDDTTTLPNPTHLFNTPGCYNISLTITTAEGCKATKKVPSGVCTSHQPHANFSGNPPINCVNQVVNFIDSSTNTYEYTGYVWDFHGPPLINESTEKNPSFLYSDTGYVDVTLVVSNHGCADTITKDNFILLKGPVAIPQYKASCSNSSNILLDGTKSIAAMTYQWLMPGGNPASANTPTVSVNYATPGVHTATLITTNDSTGCTHVSSVNYTVRDLHADFSATPLMGCSSLYTCLSNYSAGAARYQWIVTNSAGTVLFNYDYNSVCLDLTPGIYSVRLIATDSFGCADTMYKPNYLAVYNPIAEFTGAPLTGCSPLLVNFTDQSTSSRSTITGYSWNFGDAASGANDSSASKNTSHIYRKAGSYNITLTATDNFGCTSKKTRLQYVRVTQVPSTFKQVITSTCSGANACFTIDTPVTGATYKWDFGDSTTHTGSNPCHMYTSSGSYTVMLAVSNPAGCKDTSYATITINITKPNASLIADTTFSTCPPLQVSLTNLSTDVQPNSTYRWDFGDGQTSSTPNPIHIYNAAGVFDVTLIVRNPNGCSDTVVFEDYINIGGPSAFITSDPTSGCAPHYTCITAKSITATKFTWNFGDGTVLVGDDSTCYTYERTGTFYPELILSNGAGCVFYMPLKPVTIGGATANFTVSNTSFCEQGIAQFTDSSYGVSAIQTRQWNFGDPASGVLNTSNQQNPSHTYTSTGSYTATLHITTADGCENTATKTIISGGAPVIKFTVDDTSVCSPQLVNFAEHTLSDSGIVLRQWNFGDPTSGIADTSSSQFPTHTYTTPGTYIVSLIEASTNGCPDTAYATIQAHQNPLITFSAFDTCLNTQPIAFTNSTQFANQYTWNFGDNNTSAQPAPTHSYADSGTYNVSLVAANTFCADTTTLQVSIYPVPVAAFTLPNNSLCGAFAVLNPTNTSTGANRYLWNFGNGETSTTPAPTITYANPGEYNIVLRAWNNFGCTDTATFVTASHQKPEASFVAYDTCLNTQPMLFFNSSQLADRYIWNYGEGAPIEQTRGGHEYTDTGTYIITLIALTDFCSDTFTMPVSVFPSPEADFTIPLTSICGPPAVIIPTNKSTGATKYRWDYGNGDTSALLTPIISYSTAGQYLIKLKAINGFGCFDTASAPFTVNQKPEATFIATDTCLNTQPLQFVNNTQYADLYRWDLGDSTTSALRTPTHTYTDTGLYVIQLITTNQFCTDTFSVPINIFSVPDAAFTLPYTYLCGPPATITPTNNSTGADSYLWNFGDGNSSILPVPNITYTTANSYVVTLTASTVHGCIDTAAVPLIIHPYPNIRNIDLSPVEGCAPFSINLDANVSDGQLFSWNFGDNAGSVNSTTPFTNHTYEDTGVYTVTLKVVSFEDCADTLTLADTITVHIQPIADFEYELNTAIDPVNGTIQLTNTSQHADSYFWEFGDGVTSIFENPEHLYQWAGEFEITLVAKTNYGCVDSISKSVEVMKKTLYVPNAFAPDFNGDGLVKTWQPIGIGLKEYKAQIFNTWGELMWESTLLTTVDGKPAEGWDGTYRDKPCPQDAYVWKIRAIFLDGTEWQGMTFIKDGPRKTIGSVTLIR